MLSVVSWLHSPMYAFLVDESVRCRLVAKHQVYGKQGNTGSMRSERAVRDIPGIAKVHGSEAEGAHTDASRGREQAVPAQSALRGGGSW